MKTLRVFTFFLLSVSMLIFETTGLASGPNPKTTGDVGWVNSPGYYNQPATTTFNAIAIRATGLDAKGSALYSDPNISYTMDVQFVNVNGNTAWFAGQVTSVQGDDTSICCAIGNWIFYKVQDNGEPGIGADLIWGQDLGATSSEFAHEMVLNERTPGGGPFTINEGNLQVH